MGIPVGASGLSDTVLGEDKVARCHWASTAPEFAGYHDREWGFPVADDLRLFEKISLEGFQSGLSWRTILNKRENFRRAFCGFDFYRVAKFEDADVERLLGDAGIIRHRRKIEATINNAHRAIELVNEAGSLAAFFWQYEEENVAEPQSRSTSALSVKLSKDLKKRGWQFVGPTTAFAFMQAMGLINDHVQGCEAKDLAAKARENFVVPGISNHAD